MGFISNVKSIFGFTCPKCHEGDLFIKGTFAFEKPFEMYDRCPKCNLNFMPEPGFYYGAMFISYIFTSFFCLGFIAIFHWVLGWSTGASFALLILFLAIFFIAIFRLARSIWISIVTRYDPNAIQKHQAKLAQQNETKN